ncbi:anti-sigma-D factor RsdA [Rhodococcus rhodnii]|uniref:Anti-sigma-D factor RsdA sigma factor binding region domain-containing protein n=1 Tax=Rhodococcus rhodnii LMG 5362 TaxID=1273125 RepID=R7WJT8_9NOCA|nr:anti-sigma-D factor RsdA [Rhodococcus rhodnii]EOM75545.1 hypothetical protein Rrhod_3343 [Rhodococcus rhodnii LMG 5362]
MAGDDRDGGVDPDDAGDGAPLDVTAVRRDDALIDAIAGNGPVATDSPEQYELALALTAWRSSIVSEPLPSGPTLDEAAAALGARPQRSRPRRLSIVRPAAAAAALVVVALGGGTLVSWNAQPGDPLWGVKSVVFSNQADSTMARVDASTQLDDARAALESGDLGSAQRLLEAARGSADGVRDAAQRAELDALIARLDAELRAAAVPQEVPPPVVEAPDVVPQAPVVPPAPEQPAPQPLPPVLPPPPTDVPLPPQDTTAATLPPTSTTTPDPGIMMAPVQPTTTPPGSSNSPGGLPTTTAASPAPPSTSGN